MFSLLMTLTDSWIDTLTKHSVTLPINSSLGNQKLRGVTVRAPGKAGISSQRAPPGEILMVRDGALVPLDGSET